MEIIKITLIIWINKSTLDFEKEGIENFIKHIEKSRTLKILKLDFGGYQFDIFYKWKIKQY